MTDPVIVDAGPALNFFSINKDLGEVMVLAEHQIVLERGVGRRYLPDRKAMRRIYAQLRECDDGLVDITQTDPLSKRVWANA